MSGRVVSVQQVAVCGLCWLVADPLIGGLLLDKPAIEVMRGMIQTSLFTLALVFTSEAR